DYIASPTKDGEGHENVFVRLPELDDREALILCRTRLSYLVLNRFPYNPGHLLAVPLREVPDISDLDEEERHDLFELIVRGKNLMKEVMKPDGFNIGFGRGTAAGAGMTADVHAHVVPRWNGGTIFMPVIGKPRALPEALEATWKKLREHLGYGH